MQERNKGLLSINNYYFGCHTFAINLILTDRVDTPKGGKLGGKSDFVSKCQNSILNGNS